jgi:UDPglucose--hexose-1-phosphate uridylyltransferase
MLPPEFRDRSHWRLNLLTNDRVLVSPHRLQRPWQGKIEEVSTDRLPVHDPPSYLCPGNARAGGHLNPKYDSTFVFTNDFSALLPDGQTADLSDDGLLVAGSESGICRVLCFSPRHDLTLAQMETAEIVPVVRTWIDETRSLAQRPGIRYVQVFENKGAIMGCSNPHPHGQIWATSSVPTEVGREDESQRAHFQRHGETLLGAYLRKELAAEERIVCANPDWVCLVPWWAKWPYETMLISRRPHQSLLTLSEPEQRNLADIIRSIGRRYDNLFGVSFPYTMGFHQAPITGGDNPHWHLHAHYYPPLLRSATVQKFMVGFEMLAMPQRDLVPELAAKTLRELSEDKRAVSHD